MGPNSPPQVVSAQPPPPPPQVVSQQHPPPPPPIQVPPPLPPAFFPHYPLMQMMQPPPNYFNIGQHPAPCGQPRRKNATRETTMVLKQWLNQHKRNPYPTKNEKIFLAVVTQMTMTQVSTWFANARRRLKKENKMTWSPRNRCDDDDDEDDDLDDDMDDDQRSLSQDNDQDQHIQPDIISPLPKPHAHLNLSQQLQAAQQQQQHQQQQQNQRQQQELQNTHLHNLQAQLHMLGQLQHHHQQHHLQQQQQLPLQLGQIKLEAPDSHHQNTNPTISNNGHQAALAEDRKTMIWRPFM